MRPDFLLLGAAKAGTTSLAQYLGQHPGVFMARKDLNYFLDHPAARSPFRGPDVTHARAAKGSEDYRAAFEEAPPGSLAGDASHIYLYAPEAPGLIRQRLGTPHLVVVLRHPVERAYSHYAFNRGLGTELLPSFEEALAAEDMRVEAGWDPVFHYRRRGLYGEQLARYLEVFPAARLQVLVFEELFADPAAALRGLFEFLGVDPDFAPDVSQVHVPGGDVRAPTIQAAPATGLPPPAPLDPALRRRLAAGYAEDLERLETATGLCLEAWRT